MSDANATAAASPLTKNIDAARAAWEAGQYVVAHEIRRVLKKRAIKLAIDFPEPEHGMTLAKAKHRFVTALSAARAIEPAIAQDVDFQADRLRLWRFALEKTCIVKGGPLQDEPRFIASTPLDPDLDADLSAAAAFYLEHRQHWKKSDWQKFIVEPLHSYAAEWREWFSGLAGLMAQSQPAPSAVSLEWSSTGSPKDWCRVYGSGRRAMPLSTLHRRIETGIIHVKKLNSKVWKIDRADLPPLHPEFKSRQ